MLPHLHLYGPAWGAAALAWAACGTLSLVRRARPRGGVHPLAAAALLLATAAATFAGARLHHLCLAANAWSEVLHEGLLLPAGEGAGLRIGGGLLAALAVLLAFAPRAVGGRLTRAEALDAVVPAAGVAILVGRLGCFADGCCFGVPSAVPWAVAFPFGSPAYWSHVAQGLLSDGGGRSLPVHPLQLYLGGAGLLSFLAATAAARSRRQPGMPTLLFVAVMSALRLAVEPLRESSFGFGVPFQAALDGSLLAGALALLAWRQRRAVVASAFSSAG